MNRVTIRREFEAPAEELFDAWLDSDRLARWLRRPGELRLIAVERPRWLVFTLNSPVTNDQDATVTVHLRALGQRTELVVIHEQPIAAATFDSHR